MTSRGTSAAPSGTEAETLLALDAEFEQVRSRDRVRDLAEVFTHQREIDAILDQMPAAFREVGWKFLEPACGSGNLHLPEHLTGPVLQLPNADHM